MTENQKRRIEDRLPGQPLQWDEESANDEILALHRQLAAERLRADTAEQRATTKSQECIDLRERMAAVPTQAEQVAAVRRAAIPHALESAYARLLQAVKVYSFNYMQDEAEDEEDCVCGPKQHAEAKEVFAAIKEVEHYITLATKEAAAAEVPSDAAMLDFLDKWAANNRAEGWFEFHFAFDTSGTARQQIAEQMGIEAQQQSSQGEKGGDDE